MADGVDYGPPPTRLIAFLVTELLCVNSGEDNEDHDQSPQRRAVYNPHTLARAKDNLKRCGEETGITGSVEEIPEQPASVTATKIVVPAHQPRKDNEMGDDADLKTQMHGQEICDEKQPVGVFD